MSKLTRAVRTVIWLPFAALSHPGTIILGGALLGILNPPQAFGSIFMVLIIGCVLFPIARVLKPPRQSLLAAPPRGKPLIAALVRAAQRVKYRSPGRSAFTKSLSPQLKRLLKQPANQKPAAVKFEEAKIAGYRIERSEAPAGGS